MNLLVITADDLSYGAIGCEGCKLPDVTPNIDGFSNESYHFHNAHTTVGLCQPARSVLLTGLYPWNNGALGFCPVKDSIITMPEVLKAHGYRTGIIGKLSHHSPVAKFSWDFAQIDHLSNEGRKPKLYEKLVDYFLSGSQPFFLLVNSHDPHRPLPKTSIFNPNDVEIPPFLNDKKGTRSELALYHTAVNRFDKMVGLVLNCLTKHKLDDDTLVILTTDHGMPFPFVKANCYAFSSRIPLMYKFPTIKPNNDTEHMVAGVDFMPTIMDFIGIGGLQFDGSSYADLLRGKEQNRSMIYTCLIQLASKRVHDTRAVHTKDWVYIKNFWSDGKKVFCEDGSSPDQKAFRDLTPHRRQLLKFKVPEELYDLKNDYYALNNLATDENYSGILDEMRLILFQQATEHRDHRTLRYLQPIRVL